MSLRRTRHPAPEQTENRGWADLLKFLVAIPITVGVFFVVWALLNVGWTALLQRHITPAVFAEPCQRLAATSAELTGYIKRETSRRGKLLRFARCHFGEREVVVYDPVWSREFSSREFWLLLVVDGIGLVVCLSCALAGTLWLAATIYSRIGIGAARKSSDQTVNHEKNPESKQ